MTTVLNDAVSRPYMLSDMVMQAQRLSAALPPDDWDAETVRPGLIRQPSGIFDIICFPVPDEVEDDDHETEGDQLIRAATTTSGAPQDDVEEVGWLKRIVHSIRQWLCGRRNEE